MTRATNASKAREHGVGLPKKPDDEPIEAVIFDMDGVVTQSMRAHFAAWKDVFDAFLKGHAEAQGGPYVPFRMEDYFTYVDGVPRFDGTRRFLNSRGITLPEGAPDSLEPHTVHGLGNRKNQRFRAWLEHNKVPTYADTLGLIHAAKDRGIKVGVFSASRNAEQVLESAGVLDLFDVKVDGVDADELRLAPKPDPALLLETTRRLGATPSRVIVVEDAVSGVKAGAAGGFRHVIGIDREQIREHEHYRALHTSGADVVTRDLGDVYDLCLPAARPEENTR
jgi:beta-phosphoglucomutase family hydrolase